MNHKWPKLAGRCERPGCSVERVMEQGKWWFRGVRVSLEGMFISPGPCSGRVDARPPTEVVDTRKHAWTSEGAEYGRRCSRLGCQAQFRSKSHRDRYRASPTAKWRHEPGPCGGKR